MNWRIFRKLLVVFALGFSSGLPFALLGTTLQAWYADKQASVMMIGLLGLTSLPYTFRFFWGPVLDKYVLFHMGRRCGWLISTQLFLLIGLLLLSFSHPEKHPVFVGIFVFILAIAAASQDAVIDAHRTEYLTVRLHGLGASVASTAYRIAFLLSGAVAMIAADQIGWKITYQAMALLMLVGICATVYSKEPKGLPVQDQLKEAFVHAIVELRQREGIVFLLAFIFFYKFAEAFTSITSPIMQPFLLQKLHFSLSSIGYINKGLGIIATVAGGVVAGVLLLRWELYKALMIFGLIQAATNLGYIVLAWVGHDIRVLAISVIADNFANGLGTTALVALFMRIVDRRFTATQFSLFVAFASIPRVICGPIGALVEVNFGWLFLFVLSFLIALLYIPFLYRIRHKTKSESIITTKAPVYQ